MKLFLSTAAVAALAALAFTGPASAGCVEENQCISNMTELTIGGLAGFGGMGAAAFNGDEGYAMTEKLGAAGVDITLSGAGDGCGPDCSDFGWTFNGYANEHVVAGAGALTSTPGGTAAVINEGFALGTITVGVGKIGTSGND